ncbi:MAG: FAD-binding oxidoreductase [Burkholderiaceae bacterium]|jgi:D-lactate dehydrogenase (cytochrome)|nr:FAD-binding oxidoreductase [Burkholderiaceae bacterium]
MFKRSFLKACEEAVGADYVITDEKQMQPFVTECRKRFTGSALAVVKPSTTAEVAEIVRLCNHYYVPLVPQGGNTGLVLGSVPDDSGKAIVLSLVRLNRVREVDAANNTITAEAGCILDHIHNAAEDAGRIFPLSLASSGSCTIGGNLSANAGGTAVLRYGTARALCLGLEAVTGEGDVLDGLRSLRKDNTGYDLRDLFIGAEGTLGVITAAVLKLYPPPKTRLTAIAAMSTPGNALELLNIAQRYCGTSLTAFELLSKYATELVLKHFPSLRTPLPPMYEQYTLIELSDSESEHHAITMLESFLEYALEEEIILDAAVAQSIAQSQNMWQLRENISAAQAMEGMNIKHDISLPVSSVPSFITETDHLLQARFPGCRMVTFGHLGDGSLHYNVSAPEDMPDEVFLADSKEINRIVYDSVARFSGSISAEHGLGALKREELARHKSEAEIALMKKIKAVFDPRNLMNPGKVLP